MHIVNPDLRRQRRRIANDRKRPGDEPGAGQTVRALTDHLKQGAAA